MTPSNSDIESSFRKSIGDNLEDATPRLHYADWLEEQGRSEEAEHHRNIAHMLSTASTVAPKFEDPWMYSDNAFQQEMYAKRTTAGATGTTKRLARGKHSEATAARKAAI